MKTDQFVEFIASVPLEKQVGVRTKLARLLETALRTREKHGLNLDPICKIITTATA